MSLLEDAGKVDVEMFGLDVVAPFAQLTPRSFSEGAKRGAFRRRSR